ncbi:MAG: hypothetical protein QM756_33775 [Polyangiaceae bacterium]
MTRVLMVETDARLISAVTRALARYGVEVCAVDGIERAGELLGRERFALILIDSNLVSERDLPVFAGTPIVITSAFLERTHAERFTRVARLLQKPFTSAELSQVLDDELGLVPSTDSLLDRLSHAHRGKNSCGLRVGPGELVLEHGELVHAAVAGIQGEAALVEILARGGEVTLGAVCSSARTIQRPFGPLLLDALRAVEERDRLSEARVPRGFKLRSLRGGAR